MLKIKKLFNKLTKIQKIVFGVIILSSILFLGVFVPTLSNLINGREQTTRVIWDGSVASSYKSGTGTKEDPYVISDGSELAYLSEKLSEVNYLNNYFTISNNIYLNEGVIRYQDNEIEYLIDDNIYYVEKYTNKYYETKDKDTAPIGTLNIFPALNGFRGFFDGNLNTIYGLYITEETDEVALFTNLSGDVTNLFITNSLVYGGHVTSGLTSSSSNNEISNVIYDGYVASNSSGEIKSIINDIEFDEILVDDIEVIDFIDIPEIQNFIKYDVTSSKISGSYEIIGNQDITIMINDIDINSGVFEIDLENNVPSQISIIVNSPVLDNTTIKFSNLKHTLNYNYSVSGGIVGIANNVILNNVVNKGTIEGKTISGGLVGTTLGSLVINHSYNEGEIISDYTTGGIIGEIEDVTSNTEINYSYNNGKQQSLIKGGLLGILNNSENLSCNNSFNNTLLPGIDIVNNTDLNLVNCYLREGIEPVNEGTYNGTFILKEEEFFYDINNLITYLNLNQFESVIYLEEDEKALWVYEDETLPKLYFHYQQAKFINIHVGNLFYNQFKFDLEPNYTNSSLSFMFDVINDLTPINKVYYYMSEFQEPFSKSELTQIEAWEEFDDIIQRTNEGNYTLYVKVIDYMERDTYLNSDYYIIDRTNPAAAIEDYYGSIWDSYNDVVNTKYINSPQDYLVSFDDNLSGIKSVKYLLSSEIISESDLIEETSWLNYDEKILFDTPGKNIIYVMVEDNSGNITFINSDFISYSGYNLSIAPGFDNVSNIFNDPAVNITSNSALTLNFTYHDYAPYDAEDFKHYLKTNFLIPEGTNIYLINNLTSETYSYLINTDQDIYGYNSSCETEGCEKTATYPFTLFSKVGLINEEFYEDIINIEDSNIKENYTLIFKFDANYFIEDYLDLDLYIELYNGETDSVISTLQSVLKKVNIYMSEDKKASVNVQSNYDSEAIYFNSTSYTEVNFDTSLIYQTINSYEVIDATFDSLKSGIVISFVDSNNNPINRKYLQNIEIMLDDNLYKWGTDNLIRIPLGQAALDHNFDLEIFTSENITSLDNDSYYIKIDHIASYDGKYNYLHEQEVLKIPVIVSNNNYQTSYSFNVDFPNTSRIIDRDGTGDLDFKIIKSSEFDNPNIRFTLSKKDNLTAYDQSYTILNINNYINNNFEHIKNNIYYLTKSHDEEIPIILQLNLDNFQNTSYKLVFELYDGEQKIDSIKKYFIIR